MVAVIALISTACREDTPRSGDPEKPSQSARTAGSGRASAGPCTSGGYLGTDTSAPIGFGVFHTKTVWRGRRGRRFVNVYAGALWKEPKRGLVALLEIPATN